MRSKSALNETRHLIIDVFLSAVGWVLSGDVDEVQITGDSSLDWTRHSNPT